jgi:uncharacterized protein (DUF983 family)
MAFRSDLFFRCARGRCPDCGEPMRAPSAGFWSRFLNTPDTCGHCGMVLRRKEGFFLGAIVWNYGLTAFGVLPVLLFCFAQGWVGGLTAVKIAAATALVVPPFIHAFAWRLWLGTYYGWLPGQLPSAAVRTDD